MNRFYFRSLTIALITCFLISCSDDNIPLPLGEYENGVIIVNEGNFTEGDASITFYNTTADKVEKNLFNEINGRALGDVAQSAFAYDTLLFIVVNNSNKVEVVQRYSLKSLYTVEAALPRYVTVANGKGYLTEWVSFSEPGRLSIVDLATGNIDGSISVGFGAEDVKVVNNKAYVSNTFESTISVIDLEINEVVETIELPSPSPAQMQIDVNGDLWVFCKGGFDAEFNPSNDGALFKIDLSNETVATSIELNANASGKLALNPSKDKIFFYVGNNVFFQAINSTSVQTEPLIVGDEFTSLYGIGIDPVSGDIYLGDSKNFLEDGQVYQYSSIGSLHASFSVGRGPNGFVFN